MLTTFDAPPIPAFGLAIPSTTPAFRFSGTLPTEALTERHRPATLDDMVGQGAAVWQLKSFLDAPASKAFLFSGPTGVGKTTAARALANDLGVDPDWGFEVLKSAEADGDAVDRALRMLRHSCPAGSGWKLILVDEADLMTPKAAHLWLSALEDLPPRSVVVFTTNHAGKFPDRFLDRCEVIEFASDGSMLGQDAQALIDRVWKSETNRDDAPRVGEIPNVTDKDGRISFRRCVAALDPMIREAMAGRNLPAPSSPPTLAFPGPKPAHEPVSAIALRESDPTPKPAQKHGSVRRADPSRAHPRPCAMATPKSGPTPAEASALDRVDARIAAIDAEYTRLGAILRAMDDERAGLLAKRKTLAKGTRRK